VANVFIVLAIAVGVIILVEMIVFPIIEAHEASAKCENKAPPAFEKAVLKEKCSPPPSDNSSPS
jgi:hypothetical protein